MQGSRPLVFRFNPGLLMLALVATLVMGPVAFGQATTGALAGSTEAEQFEKPITPTLAVS